MIFCSKIQNTPMRQEIRNTSKNTCGLWDVCFILLLPVWFLLGSGAEPLNRQTPHLCLHCRPKRLETSRQLHFLSCFGGFFGEQPHKIAREWSIAVRYVSDSCPDSDLWSAKQVSCRVCICQGFCCCCWISVSVFQCSWSLIIVKTMGIFRKNMYPFLGFQYIFSKKSRGLILLS